ncbi:unnamed protein product [Hermetia illucens]|uniref:Uncharacterized protein n=1 Tax=Hermetia illucens TaxID=343691 RepID=A0A7R8YX67_HERIL|nr:unnamed protein product [Hermetia illucens]
MKEQDRFLNAETDLQTDFHAYELLTEADTVKVLRKWNSILNEVLEAMPEQQRGSAHLSDFNTKGDQNITNSSTKHVYVQR